MTEPRLSIAIVGAGPNGTYALERLWSVLSSCDFVPRTKIYVFEKSSHFGAGAIYNPDQPRCNLLNRITGQICFAPDESYPAAGKLLPRELRPTLYEWAQKRYSETGEKRFDLPPESWPPRYIHGLALVEHFRKYVNLLNGLSQVEVELVQDEVVDLVPENGHYSVRLDSGEKEYQVGHVLLVTGFTNNVVKEGSFEFPFAEKARGSGFSYVENPYPQSAILPEMATSSHVVGCLGMGQSAVDVILYLTEGRGGFFESATDGVSYHPSGREPARIVGISLSGVLSNSRPVNEKEVDVARLEHRGVFFTTDTVRRLRQTYGLPAEIEGFGAQLQLDFESHVFPVMCLEMAYVYYRALFGEEFALSFRDKAAPRFDEFLRGQASKFDSVSSAMAFLEAETIPLLERVESAVNSCLEGAMLEELEPFEQGCAATFFGVVIGREDFGELPRAERSELIRKRESKFGHPLEPGFHRFSWGRLIEPIPSGVYDDGEGYTRELLRYLQYDRSQSLQGNISNPSKAATDGVWRDLRDVLSEVVDYGGLLPASHKLFSSVYMRYHNRLADGGGIEQNDKMIALIKSGILDVSLGPGPVYDLDSSEDTILVTGRKTGVVRELNTLINSRLSHFSLEDCKDRLYRSLVEREVLRTWRNPGQNGLPDFVPGGPVLCSSHHPISRNGEPNSKITVLGEPSEGVLFFQFTLGRPKRNHQVLNRMIDWSGEIREELQRMGAKERGEDVRTTL